MKPNRKPAPTLTQVAPGIFVEPGVTYEPNVWECIQRHKKTRSEYNEALAKEIDTDSPEHLELHKAKWAAFDALCAVKAHNAREAAKQLSYLVAISEEEDEAPTLPPNHRDGLKLSAIADRMLALTEGPHPTKDVPFLARGKLLTRAGQLMRYHSFLANELMTVSWELYGTRDYAFHMIPMDGYVQRALNPRRRESAPFHDAKSLQRRAVSVLRSLRIDTKTADNITTRRNKGVARKR